MHWVEILKTVSGPHAFLLFLICFMCQPLGSGRHIASQPRTQPIATVSTVLSDRIEQEQKEGSGTVLTVDDAIKILEKLTSDPLQLAIRLEKFASDLEPRAALTILSRYTEKSEPGRRPALRLTTARYALLLGDFSKAAYWFEKASGAGTSATFRSMLLRAARLRVALGDTELARSITLEYRTRSAKAATGTSSQNMQKGALSASSGTDSGSSPGNAFPIPAIDLVRAEIVDAWSWIIEGNLKQAAKTIERFVRDQIHDGAEEGSPERRESLFIAWLSAEPAQTVQYKNNLIKEFPGAQETMVVTGKQKSPPLPHWMLGLAKAGNLATLSTKNKSVSGNPEKPAVPASTPTQPKAPSASSVHSASQSSPKLDRLQVGLFSREENATVLASELTSKGFSVLVEKRIFSGSADRWAVTVDPSIVPKGIMQSEPVKNTGDAHTKSGMSTLSTYETIRILLKEQGYESYPVE